MNYYQFLKFYGANGCNLNFAYDPVADTWSGNVYFDKTSVGLFANQHVFVLEDVYVGLTSPFTSGLTFPLLANQVSPVTNQTWQTSWTDDVAQDSIFAYIINDVNGKPMIQNYEVINYSNPEVRYTLDSDGHKVVPSRNQTPLKINVAFTSSVESINDRTMVIMDMSFNTPRLVATINFHGESIGEDDRLGLLLENFGRSFDEDDALIVASSDINEPLPDWQLINQKRKELLLNGENIYPYIGAYKAFINVIKFFEFQDMRVKEYWLNIDVGLPGSNVPSGNIVPGGNYILYDPNNTGFSVRYNGNVYTSGQTFIGTSVNTSPISSTLYYTMETALFQAGEVITGSVSSATATVVDDNGTWIALKNVVGTFHSAETITGATSLSTAAVTSFTHTYTSQTNQYFILSGDGEIVDTSKISHNYGKLQMFQIDGMFTGQLSPLVNHPLIPSTTWKKTNMFGLFYDLNKETGEVDQFGTPIVADDSQFTPEEVLIKIFALKNLLMQKFLPLNARIVDITGEGIYFAPYGIRTWTDQNKTFTSDVGTQVGFEVLQPAGATGYVDDLRKFQIRRFSPGMDFPVEHFTNLVNPYTLGQQYPAYSIPGLVSSIDEYYVEANTIPYPYDAEKKEYIGDEPGVVAGCPLVLQADASQFTWDDMTMTWDSVSSPFSIGYVISSGAFLVGETIVGSISGSTGTITFITILSPGGTLTAIDLSLPLLIGETITGLTSGATAHVSSFNYQATYTWDTIDFSNFYDIEWNINLPVSLTVPNGYNFNLRGRIADYYILPHFLPYAGTYNITMRLYDMFNYPSIVIQNSAVTVNSKQLEVSAFCRFRNADVYTWDDATAGQETWDDLGGSSWYFPIEGISEMSSGINEGLINFSRYRNQWDTQILNPGSGHYENLLYSTSPYAPRFGTVTLTWDNMPVSWDEMYHSTWDMYDYHAVFLGGFRVFDPSFGDGIQIDDWPVFYFAGVSPQLSPNILTLEEAAAQLNASTNPGIAKFTWTVRFYAGGSPAFAFIHACAKFAGPDGWRFVTYYQNSPGSIYGDKYSFRMPTWLDYDMNPIVTEIEDTTNPPTIIDENLLFLDVTIADLMQADSSPNVHGHAGTYQFWENLGFVKTIPPTSPDDPDQPYGEHLGELPAWRGRGAFTTNDLRFFDDQFQVPLGVPVFLIVNHSEVPGKTNFRWVVTNEVTGNVVVDVIDKPFAIVNFVDESLYNVEVWCTDSNGNPAYVKKKGFVQASQRSNMGKPLFPLDVNTEQIKDQPQLSALIPPTPIVTF